MKFIFKIIGVLMLFLLAVLVAVVLGGCSAVSVEDPDQDLNIEVNDIQDDLIFGSTMQWDDGVSISVGKPSIFTPSETAGGAIEGMQYVYFEIRLENSSTSELDPDIMLMVYSEGERAENIYDTIEGVGSTGSNSEWPTTTISPGQIVDWAVAYNVKDLDSVEVHISPGYDYDDAIFTN